jgi:hypothetical protein
MPSSSGNRALACAAFLLATGFGRSAEAQQAGGFAVERFSPSAPGGGWFVMDALDMHGSLGGAIALTTGYAHNPLRVTDGTQHLAVVSDQAFANFAAAVTYDRWRAYLDISSPLLVHGQSGTLGGYQYTAPGIDVGSNPDLLSDPRIGLDVRLYGEKASLFRAGLGAQMYFSSGNRTDYVTDGTYRAAARALFAGDLGGAYSYAGHVGVHVRPLDDSSTPGSPRGSELLFGVAAGRSFALDGKSLLVIGPEIYGATAFHALFGSNATALEGLLTGRVEGPANDGAPQLRFKLGVGGGLSPHLGEPEWRVLVGVEVVARTPAPSQ